MGAGRAQCGWSQNCALLSIPGNDRVRQSKREGGGRQTGREGDSLHSYRTLRGLERASSPSRLFAPREIQSRMNFFQRSVISWERAREAGRGNERDRGQISTPPYTKLSKNDSIRDSNRATGLGQIKATRTFPQRQKHKNMLPLESLKQPKWPGVYQTLLNLQRCTVTVAVACKTSANHTHPDPESRATY